MADDVSVPVSEGSPAIVATDDIAGRHFQLIKPAFGADGAATLVSATDPLPVVQTGTPALPTGAATAARQDTGNTTLATLALESGGNLAGAATSLALIDDAIVADDAAFTPATTKVMVVGFEFDDTLPDSVDEGDAGAARMSARREIYTQIRDAAGNERGANVDASGQLSVVDSAVKTAVEIMDDWDESDRAKVNPIAGQAGVQGGSGVVTALTQRMVLATDGALPAGTNNIGDVDIASIAAGDNNIGNVDLASAIPAGENQIGDVGKPGDVLTVTCSLDTSAYADGDVLFDTQTVTSAFRENAGRARLVSCVVLDESDQGQPFDVIFLNANNSLGTENGAPNISDANARTIIGGFSVVASDYIDLGGSRVAVLGEDSIGQLLKAGAATTSLFVGGISRGTGTYGATAIQLMLGLEWA